MLCFFKFINTLIISAPKLRKKSGKQNTAEAVLFSAFSSKALKNELAGLLTYPGFWRPSHQILESGSGFSPTLNGAYSSGTVPDLHRIPFSSLSLRRREPNSAAKVAVFPICSGTPPSFFSKLFGHLPFRTEKVLFLRHGYNR